MKKIILTSGGTAGHVWPIISIIEGIKKNSELDYLYVGSDGIEKKIAKEEKINFQSIMVGKYRSYFSLMNIVDLFKTLIGVFQAFKIINQYKPDIIFAKGGYVTFPILFGAKLKKIPVILHESDAIMGKTNIWASKFAKAICVGFPIENYQSKTKKYIYTGTPIRKDFLSEVAFTKKMPILLITGGSQGAHAINETIANILPKLIKSYEIYHLCGQKDFLKLKQKFNLINYHLAPFDSRIDILMRKADLIISRAGANTLNELSALKKAAILIPYPFASRGHQLANAKIYASSRAAEMIEEKNLTGDILLDMIERLMNNEARRRVLIENIGEYYKPNASEEIIKQIMKEIK